MFSIDKKKFRKNFKYIFLMLIILVVLILITIISDTRKNSTKEEAELDESGKPSITKLVINEICNNNSGGYADSEGKIYDWVELYNGNSHEVDLNGYSLSDDENKNKWFFGDVKIGAGEYLIIFLSGEKKDGLYTNFSLSKDGGEKLVLKNQSGKVIDAVDVVRTNKNTSIARNLEGEFKIVKKITPGFVNTNEGYEKYIGNIEKENNDVIFNEILVRNGGQFTDDYNEFSGYIELKNNTDHSISLDGYSLSDDYNEPFKWTLPDITLAKNEVIMIYTSGRNIKEDILHTNFNLNSKSGVAILSKDGFIVNKVEYENLANGVALAYIDGEYKETSVLSGGFENTTEGTEKFSEKYQKNKDSLIINEVMNSNYEYLPQNGGRYYDWIEIKNNSSDSINLSDYYLTTSLNEINMYKMPEVTLKKGEIYVLMASGDENLTNNSYYHTNFKISSKESLYLVKDKKVIDSVFISDVPKGYSYGRSDYGFKYMSIPSPLEENNSGKYEVAYSPEFSVNEGVYNDIDTLKLEIKAPGTIYYTLNGNEPSIYSNVYNEPIVLDETTVVRAINVEDGKINSNVITKSYIINENHTLPVFSLVVDRDDYNSLVYDSWNTKIEEKASVAYFDNGNGFALDCGIKMFGGSTRGLAKQSFALKFKKQYGPSELHYQVFENRDNSVYNNLVLRSGSQDYSVSMIRDPMMTSLMEETDVDVQAMKPIILYINGVYWGIYFLDEKIDEDFVGSHYNVDGSKADIVRIDGDVTAGTGENFEDLLTFMRTHNMALDENYEYIKEKINIDNMIRFWVAETYITNNDIINTRAFSHPDIDNGRWHFVFYDLDYGMYFYRVNYYTFMTDPNGMGSMYVRSVIMRSMFQNNEFRRRFVEILSEMLKDVWTEEKIINKIDEYHDLLLPEMERNQKRWGQTLSEWESEVEKLRVFARNRESYLLSQTQAYFGLTDAEMKVYFNYED